MSVVDNKCCEELAQPIFFSQQETVSLRSCKRDQIHPQEMFWSKTIKLLLGIFRQGLHILFTLSTEGAEGTAK